MPANETPPNGKRLESWKEIAAYLNREVRTAMRWEKERGLPVHRIPGKRSGVYAQTSEVDAWLRAEAPGSSHGLPDVPPPVPRDRLRRPGLLMAGLATMLLLGIAAVLLAVSAARPVTPQLRNPVSVTNDGLIKDEIMFGGRTLFFVARDGERWSLMRAPVSGGAPSSVVSYLPGSLWPLDMSPDESELLVSKPDSKAGPRPLSVVRMSDGSRRKLADVTANEAEWSPDGKMLAYASGSDLYLAGRDGSMPRRLTTLPGPAEALCWSPDGKRLRLSVEERKLIQESWRLWEVELDPPVVRKVLPGWSRARQDRELSGRWMPNGDFFVFAGVHDSVPGLFAIRERRPFYDTSPAPIRLTTSTEVVTSPVPSPDGKKIYAIIDSPLRGELTRLEPKSGQPTVWPGMPGLSAGHVAFSPDGHEAAYITYPEFNLWKMKADGTGKRQLTVGASQAAMPQWSPDGRRIAFMGCDAGGKDISKIRIIPAEGGPIEEPVTWPGWQGIPTWTPDGTSLIFGENGRFNPIPATCSLHQFDFKTGRTSDLPGTVGLWTPRACPTGRYIAATTPTNSKLVLYDMRTASVTDLARFPDSKIGDNPTWSKDGKSIYIDAPLAADPAIYGIRIADKHIERVASLRGIQRANMDYWIGLTPDGSLLITRRVQGSEIYSWDWVVP